MTHPFKFRTWDFRSNQMIKGVVLTDEGCAKIVSNQKQDDKLDVAVLFCTGWFAAPRASTMQESQLLDKEEIYVGDIIFDYTDRGGMVCVAQPDGVRFLYVDIPDGSYVIGTTWSDIWQERASIVGNIFEHPNMIINSILLEKSLQLMREYSRPNKP